MIEPNITTLTIAHLPALGQLFEAHPPVPRFSQAELRHLTLGDPTCTADTLLVAEHGEQLVGACLGALRGQRGVIKFIGVELRRRRQGIGGQLLDRVESALVAKGATEVIVGGVPPSYVLPGVDVTRTEMLTFLLGRGYTTNREARVDMCVDVARADLGSALVAAVGDSQVELRRASPTEIAKASAFAGEVFSQTWAVEVADAARFDPLPLFLAMDGERVVAFAVYDVCGQARFGPTGTHHDYRRRGIGGALLKLCLRDLHERGEPRMEIGWVGPIGYYAHVAAARISHIYWCFSKQVAS